MYETLANRDIFAITEFNKCFIIRSPRLFLTTIFGKRSDLPFFTQERSQQGEKQGFVYVFEEYYLQPNTVARHCDMSRPLFLGSYLQVTWWAFDQ